MCGRREERSDSVVGGGYLAGRAPIHVDVLPPQQEIHHFDLPVLARYEERGGARVRPKVLPDAFYAEKQLHDLMVASLGGDSIMGSPWGH